MFVLKKEFYIMFIKKPLNFIKEIKKRVVITLSFLRYNIIIYNKINSLTLNSNNNYVILLTL